MRRMAGDRKMAYGHRSFASAHLKGIPLGRFGIRSESSSPWKHFLFVDGGIAGRARSVQPWLIPSLLVDHDTLHSHIRLSAVSSTLAAELPEPSGAPVEEWVIPASAFDVEHHFEVPTGNPTRAGMASVVGDAAIHEQGSVENTAAL